VFNQGHWDTIYEESYELLRLSAIYKESCDKLKRNFGKIWDS